MTPDEREVLLRAFEPLTAHDPEGPEPLRTFLPTLRHRRALYGEIVVVLGARGAGKTSLFRLVNEARTAKKLRALFETDLIPDALWFEAFSTHSQDHPEVGTLASHAAKVGDLALRAFWMAHLLRRLDAVAPEIVQIPENVRSILAVPVADLGAWLPQAEERLGAISSVLDAADRALEAADRTLVATYDNLDLVGQFVSDVRRRYVATLLSLWLSLASRYRRLRGKVFLRDDLFDAAELGFADASKLRSKSERLDWEAPELFRVVLRHLCNGAEGEAVRAWLSDTKGLVLREVGEFGWMPGEMPVDVQRAFVTKLAGRVVGTGVLKSPTHEWLTSRLRDARGQITPRAMMWFLGFAAERAHEAEGRKARKALVSGDDLVSALKRTSRERFAELKEEYPFVVRMEGLRRMNVPIAPDVAAAKVAVRQSGEREGIPEDGPAVLEEMIRVGALRRESDGRIDVPDVYRYPLEIGPDYVAAWRDYLRSGDARARKQLERDLPVLTSMLSLTGAWSDLAAEELSRGDLAGARSICVQALHHARRLGSVEGQLSAALQLAYIAVLQGSADEARQYGVAALETSRATGNDLAQVLSLFYLGAAELIEGGPRALAHFGEARRVAERVAGDERQHVLRFLILVFGTYAAVAAESRDEIRSWTVALVDYWLSRADWPSEVEVLFFHALTQAAAACDQREYGIKFSFLVAATAKRDNNHFSKDLVDTFQQWIGRRQIPESLKAQAMEEAEAAYDEHRREWPESFARMLRQP